MCHNIKKTFKKLLFNVLLCDAYRKLYILSVACSLEAAWVVSKTGKTLYKYKHFTGMYLSVGACTLHLQTLVPTM